MDEKKLDKIDALLNKATSLLEGGNDDDIDLVESLLDQAQSLLIEVVPVVLGVTLPCGYSYSTKCYCKAYIKALLGGEIMLAKQNGDVSTLIAGESVSGAGFPQNDNFRQYKGVVVQADQKWAELP